MAGYPEEAAAINAYKSGTIKIFEEIVSNNYPFSTKQTVHSERGKNSGGAIFGDMHTAIPI
ncbi:MAG: hypothetical protein IPH74_15600 [Bacteroidetes bacterium]|nr:hypothetical protein [Bacteroidota bacterium]